MELHLSAPFTLDTWDAVADPVLDDPTAPTTGRATLAKTYEGGALTGTAVGHALTTMGPGGASYVAQERITGTLDGRAGTFVLEHGASGGAGSADLLHAVIVPRSGTGDLSGISGEGVLEHGLLTLDVDLPDR
jgi:Protein of unknown function (DUF3224)